MSGFCVYGMTEALAKTLAARKSPPRKQGCDDYTPEEMADVVDQALRQGAEAIVITEKDAVKVPDVPREIMKAESPVPIYVVSVEVTFQSGDKEFKAMLEKNLQEYVKKG